MRNALALAALAAAAPLARAQVGYATDTSTGLFSVDFTSGTATLIGMTGQFMESIALRADGVLFGANSGGVLFVINTTNGQATQIGNTGLGNIETLDFDGARLIAVDFTSTPTFYELDQGNASATPLVTAQQETGACRSGAIESPGIMLVRGDANGNTLFEVNLSTGAVRTRGIMPAQIFGMDFFGSDLLGLSNNGLMFRIDAGTGQTTQIGDTGSNFWLTLSAESGPPPCYPDCDTSTGVGILDIFDFLCFQNRYDAGAPYACDCDQSTGPGVCDIFDFLCFQNAYDAGCP